MSCVSFPKGITTKLHLTSHLSPSVAPNARCLLRLCYRKIFPRQVYKKTLLQRFLSSPAVLLTCTLTYYTHLSMCNLVIAFCIPEFALHISAYAFVFFASIPWATHTSSCPLCIQRQGHMAPKRSAWRLWEAGMQLPYSPPISNQSVCFYICKMNTIKIRLDVVDHQLFTCISIYGKVAKHCSQSSENPGYSQCIFQTKMPKACVCISETSCYILHFCLTLNSSPSSCLMKDLFRVTLMFSQSCSQTDSWDICRVLEYIFLLKPQ